MPLVSISNNSVVADEFAIIILLLITHVERHIYVTNIIIIIIMINVGEFHVRERKQFKLQWQSIKNATYYKKHRQHIYIKE